MALTRQPSFYLLDNGRMSPTHVMESVPTADFSSGPNATQQLLKQLSEPMQVKRNECKRPRVIVTEILIVLAVALFLRIPYFGWRMFPLNDGGMFAQVIDDIRAAHFILPSYTTYNLLNIPLSYPPLAFYFGAVCTVFTGGNPVPVLVWVPFLLNLICIVMVYFIAREIYPGKFYACLAGCCYAAMGRSGSWLIMGGGLTRGLGMLCALTAIVLFLISCKRDSFKIAVWSGIVLGMAALAHLEGGIYGALSLVAVALMYPRRWRNMRLLALAGTVSFLVIIPWLIWLSRHVGFEPLMDAVAAGGSYRALPTVYEWASIAAAITFTVVADFPYVWWLIATLFLMPRSGLTYAAPATALCIVWITSALVVVLTRRSQSLLRFRTVLVVVIALALSLQMTGVFGLRIPFSRPKTQFQVSAAEVQAMQAAGRVTNSDAKFLVFSQRTGDWATDMAAEWFPYFSKRQCVNTVQGREWLPNKAFSNATVAETGLEMSLRPGIIGLLHDLKPDYVFIAEPLDENHGRVAKILSDYANSAPIYQNSEVSIYKVERDERLHSE